ncbi:hypothetical protein EDB85DRAFT_1894563 [Lactarius pseudohatsudake]|nr:hypothetical protein EDB85DRAFT_1894563 [Lactarius pseudohatsudake]
MADPALVRAALIKLVGSDQPDFRTQMLRSFRVVSRSQRAGLKCIGNGSHIFALVKSSPSSIPPRALYFGSYYLKINKNCDGVVTEIERKSTLGSKQGNRHASADLTKDIKILMDSLKQNDIYEEVLGRTLGDDESPAPDVIGEGYTALTWGAKSPLRQFNRLVSTLQRRCGIQPLAGTTLPAQPQETLSECPLSEDDGPALNDPDVPQADSNLDNNEELGLDEEPEQSLDDTQLTLSLQTADDVDLEMDADLQESVEAPNEGGGTDNSDDDDDNDDFFS